MKIIKDTSIKIKKALFNPDNKLSLIPNWLSFSRAIGGIGIPILIYKKSSFIILTSATLFIALSDFFDGIAARALVKKTTEEGALLDAISDKIFSLGLIVGIVPKSPIFLVNGLLEGTISYINAKSLEKGGNPKSNLIGKIKTWPLYIALILSYASVTLDETNILSLSSKDLSLFGSALSTITIPLEIINIKDYINTSAVNNENRKIKKLIKK